VRCCCESASSRLHDSSCCSRSAGGLRIRSTRVFAFVPVERSLRPCVWLFAPLRDKVSPPQPRRSAQGSPGHRHLKHNTAGQACGSHLLVLMDAGVVGARLCAAHEQVPSAGAAIFGPAATSTGRMPLVRRPGSCGCTKSRETCGQTAA
jgi:hypothetical protein